MGISQAQYEAMLARTSPKGVPVAKPCNPVKSESDLHEQIIEHCRARGWFYEHNRMDRKTTGALGETDFTIALPGGRTAWIECKAKSKKTTKEQTETIHNLQKLGHTAGVVYSMQEFEELIARAQAGPALPQ